MKRTLLLATALGVLLGFALPAPQAQAALNVGFSIGSGGRHNGFSLGFQSEPDVVLIPSSRVYYAQDADVDLYSYDDAWYCVQDGVWYASDSYDGPFVAIGFSSVPYEIRNVPVSYRRHWEGYTSQSSGYRDGYQNRGWNQNRGGATQYRGGWSQDRGNAYQDRSGWSQNRGDPTQYRGGWSQDRGNAYQDRGGWSQNRGNPTQDRGGAWNQGGSWNDRNNSGDHGNRGHGNGGNNGRGNRGRGNWNRGGRGWGR